MSNDTQPRPGLGGGRAALSGGPVRRGLSVAGIVATGFAVLTALSWITHSSDTVTIENRIDRIEIDVAAAHVEIVGTPADETRLDFEVKSGWSRDGGIDHTVSGSTLRVSGGCDSGAFLGLWCQSELTVTVPSSAVVTASSTAPLVVSGLAAETTLESRGGSITVTGQRGPLTAHSAAGPVQVEGLDADVAKVTSSGGPVSVAAVSPPTALDAESSAGSVTVSVPGDVTYDVETDSSIGQVTVDLPTSSGARHELRAFSSAGPVEVTGSR